jgi:putative sigma-54 modulation protein
MYAAIDALADKLDRQVVKYKEKRNGNRHDPVAAKRTVAATAAPVARRRKPVAGV